MCGLSFRPAAFQFRCSCYFFLLQPFTSKSFSPTIKVGLVRKSNANFLFAKLFQLGPELLYPFFHLRLLALAQKYGGFVVTGRPRTEHSHLLSDPPARGEGWRAERRRRA